MPLTDELWSSITEIYNAILEHDFIVGLTDGTLIEESFKYYAVQDALYLREFARALSIAAAKSPVDEWMIMFNEHSAGALKVERALHESFFRDFGIDTEDVYSTPLAPNNLAYTSYLLSVAYSAPFHEVIGAILPCYWIYGEVGKELIKKGSPNALYQRWIDTYGGEEFEVIVKAVLALANEVGESLREEEKRMVKSRFITTSRYEWMFWDMGFMRQDWPVG
ncbi:MAG: thiaminase II [Candidatus Dadabacteria bacterium]|nr:thiaminase II [Candidatus Dadabacteria bacterium]